MPGHRIRLVARNEGLRYREGSSVYNFGVHREGKTWVVHLPPSKGEDFAPCDFHPQTHELMLSRIRDYLSRIWWLGIWPVRYEVSFSSSKKGFGPSGPSD